MALVQDIIRFLLLWEGHPGEQASTSWGAPGAWLGKGVQEGTGPGQIPTLRACFPIKDLSTPRQLWPFLSCGML